MTLQQGQLLFSIRSANWRPALGSKWVERAAYRRWMALGRDLEGAVSASPEVRAVNSKLVLLERVGQPGSFIRLTANELRRRYADLELAL